MRNRVRIVKGNIQKQAVRRRQAQEIAHLDRVECKRMMRMKHSFGNAGRARGVEDHRVIVGGNIWNSDLRRFTCGGALDSDLLRIGNAIANPLGRNEGPVRIRLIDDEADLLLIERSVDWYGYAAREPDSYESAKSVAAIFQEQCDTVVRADTRRYQVAGNILRELPHLPECQGRLVVFISRSLTMSFDGFSNNFERVHGSRTPYT